jgi:hypothetical protein
MKVISYSIFRAPCEKFEFMAYLRGLYFNARMNALIYPEWKTVVFVQNSVYDKYEEYFLGLPIHQVNVLGEAPLCEAMLWRMKPVFDEDVTHVLCRDADAITTHRESVSVSEWVSSNFAIHAILDNPAHSGLMGGMIGIKTYAIKGRMFKNWNDMIRRWNLTKRGSDQHLLNQDILPSLKDSVMWAKDLKSVTSSKLWESDLTCRHIGSAGVVEMETLRFFKRFDKTDYSEFEKQHSDILYWAR